MGVVACGDQQLPGGVDPDPGQGDQCGGDGGDQFLELAVELGEFGPELLPASGQVRKLAWSLLLDWSRAPYTGRTPHNWLTS